jgi:hypothetical protein
MSPTDLLDALQQARSGASLLHTLGPEAAALWALAPSVPDDDLPVLIEALALIAVDAPASFGAVIDRWLLTHALDDGLLPGWSDELDALALALWQHGHPWALHLDPGPGAAGRHLLSARCAGHWPAAPAAPTLAALATHLLTHPLPERPAWPSHPDGALRLDRAAQLTPLHEALTALVGPAWSAALREAALHHPGRRAAIEIAPAWSAAPAEPALAVLRCALPQRDSLHAAQPWLDARPDADLELWALGLADHDPDLAERCAATRLGRGPAPSLHPLVFGRAWTDEPGLRWLRAQLRDLPQPALRSIVARTLDDDEWDAALGLVPLLDHPAAAPHALRRLPDLNDRPPRAQARAVLALSTWVPDHLPALVRCAEQSSDAGVKAVISRALALGLDRHLTEHGAVPEGADHLIDLHSLDLPTPDDPLLHEEILPPLRRLLRALPARRADPILTDQLDPTRPTAARALWLLPPPPDTRWLDLAAELIVAHAATIAASPALRAWIEPHAPGLREALPDALLDASPPTRATLLAALPWSTLPLLGPTPTEPLAALRHVASLLHQRDPHAPTLPVWVLPTARLPLTLAAPRGGPACTLSAASGAPCWTPAEGHAATLTRLDLPLAALHPHGPPRHGHQALRDRLNACAIVLTPGGAPSSVQGDLLGPDRGRVPLPWPSSWA